MLTSQRKLMALLLGLVVLGVVIAGIAAERSLRTASRADTPAMQFSMRPLSG